MNLGEFTVCVWPWTNWAEQLFSSVPLQNRNGRNGHGSISSSLCFALCLMVELGPENKCIGFPFRNEERQAMWSCGFLWSIGILVFFLLVALLGAATKPLANTVKEGKGLFWFSLVVPSIVVKSWWQGLETTAYVSGSRKVNAGWCQLILYHHPYLYRKKPHSIKGESSHQNIGNPS